MDLDQLHEYTCLHLRLLAPQLDDVSLLVDECIANALKAFKPDFICQFSPEAWAKITLIYHKHFLDTGCDVSVGEIFAAVVRDAIDTKRMDFLTLNLAQHKRETRHKPPKKPQFKVVAKKPKR